MIDWEPILDATAAVLAARVAILLAALAVDWLVGEPDILWRRVPHPVVLFGRAISFMDKRLNIRRGVTGKFRQARGIESMDLEDTVEQMLKTEWQLDASMINNGIPDFVFEEFKTKCEGRTMFTKDFIAKLRTNNNTTTN